MCDKVIVIINTTLRECDTDNYGCVFIYLFCKYFFLINTTQCEWWHRYMVVFLFTYLNFFFHLVERRSQSPKFGGGDCDMLYLPESLGGLTLHPLAL